MPMELFFHAVGEPVVPGWAVSRLRKANLSSVPKCSKSPAACGKCGTLGPFLIY